MAGAGKRDAAKGKPTKTNTEPTPTNAPPTNHRRDWMALEREFVTGPTDDLAEFARARGMNRSHVATKATAAGWREKRAAHVGRVHKGATDRIAKAQIASEAAIDGRAHRTALRLLRKIAEMSKVIADPGEAKTLAQALTETWGTARRTAHLSAEPVARVAQSEMTVIIRSLDAYGQTFDEAADDAGSDAAPAGGRPPELPPDDDAGAIPREP